MAKIKSNFKNVSAGASGGYLSCSGKKDTKEAGQRGILDLPIETPFPFGIPQALLFQHSKYFSLLLEISKAGIDVGCNVPDIVLQLLVAVLQGTFHLTDAVKNGGVVTVELLADIGKAQIGQLPDQVHGGLPGFGGALVFQGAQRTVSSTE